MKYLLDTCAISELRKPECPESLRQLIETTDDPDLFLSAVTLGEIQKGVSLLPAGKRRQEFQAWLAFVQSSFDDRILPVAADTGLIWGKSQQDANKPAIPFTLPTD